VLRTIRHEHAIVEVIEEWREYSKLLNTYLGPLPSLISESDGRLHTTFNQTVASTGGLSTSNPNLQAIPIRTELGKEIRSAFVAESGSRLLSADYSQIELRILAHVSGEPKLRRRSRAGDDIHTATAVEVLGKDPSQLTSGRPLDREDDQLRDRLRDLGVRSVREPRDPARAGAGVHRRLSRTLPARAGLHPADDRAVEARRLRDEPARPPAADAGDPCLEPADALARRAPRRELRHAGLERGHHQEGDDRHPPALADEGRGARLVLQVHDELLLEVPEAEIGPVRELVREEMTGAYPLDPPLAVDIGVGDDWAEAKS
jgi:DNA polymerase-1